MEAVKRTKQLLDVDGRQVAVSSLEKPLYPTGFTKGQVIQYYVRVSGYLLPHIAGRPLTLKRYPNGVRGKHFYQKDAPPYKPDWIRTFPVPRRGGEGNGDIRYILIDDLPGLVWSANLANLEIHPFLSVAPRVDRPTSMVFDLDPGEGADIFDCAEVAFLLKRALSDAGLESFPKVSGSKGIQVYAPLNTPVNYDATQGYARGLAESLERAHPGDVVSVMAKSARAGRVFIDWSQNSDFKTTVAVYSLRAKSDAPYVSMPFSWDELRRALRKRERSALYFEPDAALRRLEKVGDRFAPVLSLKQKLPARTLAANHRRP